MRNLIAIAIALFALSGCVALPITFGIAQVGMGFSNGDPSVAPDIECLRVGPAYTCEAEHGNGFVGGALDRPGHPGPDPGPEPDVPGDDQCNEPDDDDRDDDKHPNAGRGNGPEGNPDEDPGNSGGRNRGGD